MARCGTPAALLALTGRVDAASMGAATFRNQPDKESAMHLTFVGKDPGSNPTGSPTVYRTDRGSWVVQGWVVTDPDVIASLSIPEGETAGELPDRLLQFHGRGAGDLDH
jgi:hypothetical protein